MVGMRRGAWIYKESLGVFKTGPLIATDYSLIHSTMNDWGKLWQLITRTIIRVTHSTN